MNDHYEKYSKGKRANINVNLDTLKSLESVMIRIGHKKSYEKIILHLIDQFWENEDKIKNELFNTDDFNPYHNLNEQYRKNKENETK